MAPTLTFVTAFIDLGEDRSREKSIELRCNHFLNLTKTGVPLYLFMSRSYEEIYSKIVGSPSNVALEFVELEELDTFKEIADVSYKMPTTRNEHKDTANFMILMNAKIEFMHRAMANTEGKHYAWIDFSIFHVFKEIEKTSVYLQTLAVTPLKDSFLTIPGCWLTQAEPSFHKISWRFCGGFFIGDRDSIETFYRIYRRLFKPVVVAYGLSWEVNVWAWLENAQQLECTWVSADHNDSIVQVPSSVLNL